MRIMNVNEKKFFFSNFKSIVLFPQENSLLLQELNNLREEVKIVRGIIQDYEIAKQTFDERGVHSIDALVQTLNADAGFFYIYFLYLVRKLKLPLNHR